MGIKDFSNLLHKFSDILKQSPLMDNPKFNACHMNASDFNYEIEIIIDRVKNDLNEFDKTCKKMLLLVKKEKKVTKRLGMNAIMLLFKSRLDIKDFYMHTRIFLDVLCKIIKIFYGKRGKQLPESMSKLLKNKKSLDVDNKFFTGLRKEMTWYDDFVEEGRDRIVHKLAQFRFANTKEGKSGFQILKSFNETWGTKTVKSIENFIDNTLSDLTKLIDYLIRNLRDNN